MKNFTLIKTGSNDEAQIYYSPSPINIKQSPGRRFMLLFLTLLLTFGFMSFTYAQDKGPGAGWSFYRPVTMSPATPGANFQVKVTLTAGQYTGMKSDGSDLRFYDNNNVYSEYWIEAWNNTGTSTIWVKVPSSGATVLAMYYGNPSASAGSSGTNTFDFFDDFTTALGSNWTKITTGGSITQSGSAVTISNTKGGPVSLSNTTPFTPASSSFLLETKHYEVGYYRNRFYATTGTSGISPVAFDYGYFSSAGASQPSGQVFWGSFPGSTSLVNNTNYLTQWRITDGSTYNWYTYDYSTGVAVNDGSRATTCGSNIRFISFSVTEVANTSSIVDWVRLRQYTATEPAGTIGNQYTNTTYTTPVTFTSSGYFIVPDFVTALTVQCWGGGGRGGTTNGAAYGGGGGGGAFSSSIVSVTPGSAHMVTVGAGSTTTSAGGDSWFGSTSTILAKGGNSGPTASDIQTGATGGAAESGVGTTKYSGGNGADGDNSGSAYGGGGGSSAGTGANGTTATNQDGAAAPSGGGNGGAGMYSTDGNGTAGSTPGGGGGGALANGLTDYNGGDGANGQITIYYCTANAGADQNLCDVTVTTLAGNTPSSGSGSWSVISGTAVVTTPESPTSGVTGLVIGASATLKWTTEDLLCSAFDYVVITVNTYPAITVNPSTAPQAVCLNGAAAALNVSASGAGLSYQWYSNITNVNSGGTPVGTNSSSYTPLTTTAGTLYYYCVVSGTCPPQAISDVSGAITVNPLPTAPVAIPASNFTSTGFSANWNASPGATGYYLDISNSNTFSTFVTYNLNVNNNLTHPVTGLAINTIYYYRVRAYNVNGCISANSNMITVPLLPPIVSSQPANIPVCEQSLASFTSQSSGGNPAPTATWQISTGGAFVNLTENPPYSVVTNTNPVSGITTTTLTIATTPFSYNTFQYRVIYNNTYGNVISSAATLTVNKASAGGSVTGGNIPICHGSSTGILTLSGQTGSVTKWQKKPDAGTWIDIVNTNTTYSEIPSAVGTWQYRAEVKNGVCSPTYSLPVSITVTPRPGSVISGSTTICLGQSAIVSIALTGTGPWNLTYTDGTTPVNVNNIGTSPYTFPVTITSTKTYTVTALSDQNCTSVAGDNTGSAVISINNACQVITLLQPTHLNAVISGSTSIDCGNSAILTVTFTGGTAPYMVTYNGVDYTGPNPITFNVSPASTTTFDAANISISDGHGCTGSATGSAVVIVTPLPAPVATDATDVTTGGFTAKWNASAGATGYRLDVSAASDFSTFASGYNDLNVLNVLNYPVTGLTPGVSYYYRVRAYNSICLSGNSNTISITSTLPTIDAPVITGAPFTVNCSTPATGSISFTHGTFNPGNIFTAQLSDNEGNFDSPVDIGSGTSSPISITIPANKATGTNSYRIRVVSNDPVVTGSVSSNFTITNDPCPAIYRSLVTGNWNVPGTWQVSINNGGSWTTATSSPSRADGTISIWNGNTVTVTDAITVDEVTVDAGATLIVGYNPFVNLYYLTINNGIGTDLTVNGTLLAKDFINNNSGSISFGSTGHYIHNIFISKKKSPSQILGTTEIPTATWSATSTCEIQSISYFTTASPLTGLSQNFGNFIWNCANQQGINFDLKGSLTSIQGNFTISKTGSDKLISYPVASRATLTVGGNFEIKTGSVLELGSMQNLTVTGNTILADAQCLILKSVANGTASFIDNGTISGTGSAKIERYLTPYFAPNDWKFHFLSAPVENQPIKNEFVNLPNTTDDFYAWNEELNTWINTKEDLDPVGPPYTWNNNFESNFIQGKGYLVAYPSEQLKNFTGKPYTSSSGLTVTCTNTYAPGVDVSTGWNLLGNPFPSAIDWDLVARGDGMDGALYYYDNGPPRYRYYVALTGGIGTALDGGSRYIPAMQGFMVHAKSTGTKTITMDNSDRVHLGMDNYYKNVQISDNVLNLVVEGNGSRDDARVSFYDQATTNFDGEFDAYKLFSYNTTIPELYSVTPDNTDVAINTLPLSEMYGTVPVGFQPGTSGTFTFTAEGINSFPSTVYIKLEDKKNGTIQKLNENPAYTFTSVTSDNSDRFLLHFQDATSVDDAFAGKDFSVYADGGVINVLAIKAIIGLVKVYDMAGREVASTALLPDQVTRINMHQQTGVYLVSVIHSKGTSNSKLVIK